MVKYAIIITRHNERGNMYAQNRQEEKLFLCLVPYATLCNIVDDDDMLIIIIIIIFIIKRASLLFDLIVNREQELQRSEERFARCLVCWLFLSCNVFYKKGKAFIRG